jgi:hypothetical protein
MAGWHHRRMGRLSLLIVFFALPSAASAQDQDRARQLFEQGVSAMDSGDPSRAAGYFNESYQLYPRASTACNMAVAQERLNAPCDAQSWYQQCAALDRAGRFRDHANRQAAALGSQCAMQSSAVRTGPVVQPPPNNGYAPPQNSQLQIIEAGQPIAQYDEPSPDHTLLGVGIAGLALGVGALVGAIFAQDAAWAEFDAISVNGGPLVEGSADADHYAQAVFFSDLSIGLYVGAGVLGGLGVIFLIVDLAQPGVFASAALDRDGVGVRF